MEKDARYFVVGIFVSAMLVGMVAFVIWLAGSHDTRHYDHYTIYFTDSVSGLNEGAAVQYKGVQVGKVTDIRLAPERKDLIKVDIEVGEKTPIRAHTEAVLATQGVTGLVFVQLTTQPNDNLPPQRIEGEDYPVLQGSGSQLSKLFQDIPTINKQLIEITTKINAFMTPDNMATLNQALTNVERMTRDMNGLLSADNVSNATDALKNVTEASAGFAPTMDRMNRAADQLEATVNRLNDMIVKNEGNINKFTGEGLRQVTATSREAQDMAKSIRELADKLKQNPSSLLYKPSYQGVEIRK